MKALAWFILFPLGMILLAQVPVLFFVLLLVVGAGTYGKSK